MDTKTIELAKDGAVIALHDGVVLIRNFSPHLEPEDAVLYAERFGKPVESLLNAEKDMEV